ncbi:Protein IDA, partial [Cucurbita argyrosperma subsp. argyrosperma]
MLSSSSSSSSSLSAIFVLLLLLVSGFCSATRPGKTMGHELKPDLLNFNYKTGFRYVGQTFSYLPRGVPIPPSGPSDRHNSLVDSLPPS